MGYIGASAPHDEHDPAPERPQPRPVDAGLSSSVPAVGDMATCRATYKNAVKIALDLTESGFAIWLGMHKEILQGILHVMLSVSACAKM